MDITTLSPPVSGEDHRLGAGDARLEITVFGDYECPYSRRLDRIVRGDVLPAHPDEVAYVFRHFPLDKIHPRALEAALAAEAAAAQGRFWDLHVMLYDNQRNLARRKVLRMAARIDGLDMERFTQDLDDRVHSDQVRADVRSGVGSGVEATPTAFLNGQRWEQVALQEIVDDVEALLRGDN